MSVWKKNRSASDAIMSSNKAPPKPSQPDTTRPPAMAREKLHSSAGRPVSNDSMGTGRVKCVLSGDSIVLWISGEAGGSPQEKQITLSLLSAPRIARGKDTGQDQPFAWESREYLRHLLVSQNVSYRIDFTHPTSGRQYGWIRAQDGTNINLKVARAGWAHVQEPRGGKGPRGKDHEQLLDAAAEAQSANVGIYTKDANALKRSVRTVTERFDSRQHFEQVRNDQPLKGVVEGVLDGSTVRILLVPSFYSIVCRLGGVQCPLWKRQESDDKSEPATRVAQPMAPQAKYLTEYCLLNRDVMVTLMGVNKDDTYYGTVLYRGKNVADELLKQGLAMYVPWNASEGDKARFRKTEALAKAKGAGMWKGKPNRSTTSSKPTEFVATVRDVRTGSRISCEDDSGVIYDAFFSSVIAPKLNSRNPKDDEKLGFESKEYLRKKIIGKRVRLMFDYDKPAQPSKIEGDPDAPARHFYSVYLGKKHLPLAMVEQGLATVITHRREEARSREYSALLEAEVAAKSAKKGLWSPSVDTKRVNDMSHVKSAQAKQYLKFVQKSGMIGIVEFMLNPVRMKLYLPSLNSFISFTVAGVRAPWYHPAKPGKENDFYGKEAIEFARSYLHQRRVEIEVFTTDKGGNFIGSLKFGKGGDYATVLLEAGAASLSEQSDRYPQYESMKAAQTIAQQSRRGIWQHWKPETEVAKVEENKPEMAELLVTHIVDASMFYCQHASDQDVGKLAQMMNILQESNKGQPSHAGLTDWKSGDLAAAKFEYDGMWYRVRLLEQEGQRLWRVFYIDFGNSEVVPMSELRPLDARVRNVPVQAKQCHLALLHVPHLDDEHGVPAAQLLKDLTWGTVLLASIEWKDKKTGAYHVTLGDPVTKVNINKVMVRRGLALVRSDKAQENPRYQVPIKQLMVEQEGARADRINYFYLGDIDVEDILQEAQQQ